MTFFAISASGVHSERLESSSDDRYVVERLVTSMRERTGGQEEEVQLNRTIEKLRTVVSARKEEWDESQTARDELRRATRH